MSTPENIPTPEVIKEIIEAEKLAIKNAPVVQNLHPARVARCHFCGQPEDMEHMEEVQDMPTPREITFRLKCRNCREICPHCGTLTLAHKCPSCGKHEVESNRVTVMS